jgi:hypothetical protein
LTQAGVLGSGIVAAALADRPLEKTASTVGDPRRSPRWETRAFLNAGTAA